MSKAPRLLSEHEVLEQVMESHAPAFRRLSDGSPDGIDDFDDAARFHAVFGDPKSREYAEFWSGPTAAQKLQEQLEHHRPAEQEPVESLQPADPACEVIRHMLHGQLVAERAEHLLSEPGHCVILLAPEPWLAALECWSKDGLVGPGVTYFSQGVSSALTAAVEDGLRPVQVLAVPGDRKRKGQLPVGADITLSYGHTVIGIASDLAHLPSDITAKPDAILQLSGPRRWVIQHVAESRHACRVRMPPGLCEDACRSLTPVDIRVTWRRGEDGQQWLNRLAQLARRRGYGQGGWKPSGKARKATAADGLTLDDLHGMGDAVAWGRALVRDLGDCSAGRIGWSDVDPGCLLSGPPGTGKTTFASALARSAGCHFIATSYAQWQASGEAHLGEMLKAMRATFEEAKANAPAIVFIDELDSFPRRGGGTSKADSYMRAAVNGLLECLTGVAGLEGVVVLGATNHPDILDPALVRAGRMDTIVHIPLPDTGALEGILRHHLGDLLPDADLSPLAARARTAGWTGADIERACRVAKRVARHAGRQMSLEDLSKAFPGDSKLGGPQVYEVTAIPVVLMPRPGEAVH